MVLSHIPLGNFKVRIIYSCGVGYKVGPLEMSFIYLVKKSCKSILIFILSLID